MQPNISRRKIGLVLFDMDGVLIDITGYNENAKKVAVSTWNAVFDKIGIYSEHERLKKLFIKGIFSSYMEWTHEACRLLRKHGLKQAKFMEIINSRPLMRGARELLFELKKRGYKTAVITGSFKELAERIKKLLGLDFAIAHCELIFDKDNNLKEWKLTPCDFGGKVEFFNKIVNRLGLKTINCAYIGDEVNDIPIFKKVGLSIAFNCRKRDVEKSAHIVIEKKDLRGILQYLPPLDK